MSYLIKHVGCKRTLKITNFFASIISLLTVNQIMTLKANATLLATKNAITAARRTINA
jgi:hypothetical protein